MESGTRQLTSTDLQTLTTSKTESYGAQGVTSDGRRFRYVSFGGTSTVAPGNLFVAPAAVANYQGLALTAVGTSGQTTAGLTLGSIQLVVTNGSTAVTQDQFAEGYIEILQTSGTNNGPQVYKVRGNTAALANAAFTVFLSPREPLRNASVLVAGTDTVNLRVSPYSSIVTSSTAGRPIGVNLQQVVNTASVTNYGWVQTTGDVLLTNDAGGNLTVGEAVTQSVTTAGNIVASGATTYQIGQTTKAFNASTTGPVRLSIDQ